MHFGNPWIFSKIEYYLKTGEKPKEITLIEKLNTIMEHFKLEIEEKGEIIAVHEMRKHISWYIKNLKDASKVREKINRIESSVEVIDCLKEYFNYLSHNIE